MNVIEKLAKPVRTVLSAVSEVVGRHNSMQGKWNEHDLTHAILALQSEYIRSSNTVPVYELILPYVLQYTQSAAVAYAEVDNGKINIVARHASVPPRAAGSSGEYTGEIETETGTAQAFAAQELQAMLSQVVQAGQTIILQPASQAIDAFIGVPFFSDDELLAVIAMWDRVGGYSAQFKSDFLPLFSACEKINAAHHTNKIGQADIAKLRSAEQQLRACWSSMRESMLFMDEQGVVQFANNAAYQLFDYPADELQGAYLQQLIAAPFSEHLCQTIHHLAKANIDRRDQLPKEVSIIRKYGAVLPVEFTLTQTTIDNNNHFIAVLRDLTTQNDIKRIRREFVSLINQELRAPLTSIHGSLDLISGGAVGHVNGQIKQLVGVASKNTKRMIRLINDILDMEKMQTGRLAFNYSSQSVLPLVEQAVEAISSYAAEKNVRVIVQEFLNRSEFIKVDVDRMLQVFSYLLSNAVKYSPKGNEVRVQIRKEQGAVKISIRDFGPGLPREFQMRFFRSDDHADMRSSHMEGVGLSLSMAKMLTEKMGGEIGYDGDEHPGALFYIKLSEWQTVSETETRQA